MASNPIAPATSSSNLLGMYGTCVDCGATNTANNAVGWGAQHAAKTGHYVQVEVTRCIHFNRKD